MGHLSAQAREPIPKQPGGEQAQAQDVAKKHQYLVGHLVAEKSDPNPHPSKEKLAADDEGHAQGQAFSESVKPHPDRSSWR